MKNISTKISSYQLMKKLILLRIITIKEIIKLSKLNNIILNQMV